MAKNCTALALEMGVVVEFHAISCTVNKPICKADKDVKGYPTVKFYAAGNSTGVKVPYYQSSCYRALKHFGVDYYKDIDETSHQVHGKTEVAAEAPPPNHDSRTKKEIYDDAFISFDFALRQSIYMSLGPLSNSTRDAFDEWIDLLEVSLPQTWRIHKAIDAIVENWENVVVDEDALTAIAKEHGPSSREWTCKSGYTCGLWELFHIMTIGVVEHNRATEFSIFPVAEVADTLHNYISEFFACDVCRRHFLEEYDACAHDRCTRLGSSDTDVQEWKQLSLWLWEAHNSVNVRLMHERAERDHRVVGRAQEIAATWPSRDDCPVCWHEDGTWDDETIYMYLRMIYWPDDDTTIKYKDELNAGSERKLVRAKRARLFPDDEEEEEKQIPLLTMVVPLVCVVVIGLLYSLKRAEVARTGRHKKMDLIS